MYILKSYNRSQYYYSGRPQKKKQNPVLLERWTSQKILKITKSGLALQVFKHGLFSQAQHTLRRDPLDFFQHF